MAIYGPYMPYMDHIWPYMGHLHLSSCHLLRASWSCKIIGTFKIHEAPEIPIWPYMAIYGHIWAIYGHIWAIYGPYMAIYGHIWPYMAIYGHIWSIYGPYMAIYGPYMAIYGHVWPYRDFRCFMNFEGSNDFAGPGSTQEMA